MTEGSEVIDPAVAKFMEALDDAIQSNRSDVQEPLADFHAALNGNIAAEALDAIEGSVVAMFGQIERGARSVGWSPQNRSLYRARLGDVLGQIDLALAGSGSIELDRAEKEAAKARAAAAKTVAELEEAVENLDSERVLRLRIESQVHQPVAIANAEMAVLDIRLARAEVAGAIPTQRSAASAAALEGLRSERIALLEAVNQIELRMEDALIQSQRDDRAAVFVRRLVNDLGRQSESLVATREQAADALRRIAGLPDTSEIESRFLAEQAEDSARERSLQAGQSFHRVDDLRR
jgi:hypothetical protein